MTDWGHEGHVLAPENGCFPPFFIIGATWGHEKPITRHHARVRVHNGILVAPSGPNAQKPQFSAIPWGHVPAPWGHVQPVASLWTEKVLYADPR